MIRKTDLWTVGVQWDARRAAYKHAAKRGDRTASLLRCVIVVSQLHTLHRVLGRM